VTRGCVSPINQAGEIESADGDLIGSCREEEIPRDM